MQTCPLNFKVTAGGPCESLPSPPPNPCPGLVKNGDLNQNMEIDIDDLDQIAKFVINVETLDDCQQFVADGKCAC